MNRVSSINTRFIGAIVSVALGACLPLGAISVSHLRTSQAAAVASDGDVMKVMADRMLAGEAARLKTLVTAVAVLPNLLDATAAGDRQRAGERLAPVHKATDAIGISALAITTTPTTVLYRSNNPEVFGDNVADRRPDLVATEKTGEPSVSYNRVRDGIGLAYAVPMVRDGQRIAVLSAQMTLGADLFKRIGAATGADVVAHAVEASATPVIGGTVPEGAIEDPAVLRSAFDAPFAPRLVVRGGATLLIAALPIRDFLGRPVVVLELIKDRSAAAAADSATQLKLLLVAASILAAAIAAGFLLARGIIRPLRRMAGAAEALARGETAEPVVGRDRSDEFGAVAQALEVLRKEAVRARDLDEQAQVAREAGEAGRSRTEAERVEAAAQQGVVVDMLAGGLSRLAGGDLTCRLNTTFAPEYERLRIDFNAAMDGLADTMTTIVQTARGIGAGTGEISQGADDLSRRTEQQAASLEETAAALDEITATVRKTADGARHASDVVTTARTDADRSAEVVRDAVAAMAEIERSAKEIGQIIGVIDEIAFQTNLLALNAGVEAARAGEAGKGFAVVASEVRALAQRSADAAKEIKGLVSTSSTQVATGVALVGQTGQALGRIAAQVSDISGVVREIAASAQEQSTGLAEVNAAVNQMDQTTQQNAAMVEQSTAASHALAHEAGELGRLVARFRLDGAGGSGQADAPMTVTVPARRPDAARSRPASLPARALKVVGGRPDYAHSTPAPAHEEGWEEF